MELIARLSLPGLFFVILGFAFLIWFLPYKNSSDGEAESDEN